jgi:hypothetical protein
MKLTLYINGELIDNPTTQVQIVYDQGTVKQYFKWMKSLNSIIQRHTIRKKFRLALQTIRGRYATLWHREGVKLLPLPQPPVRARTDARTNPSAQRATQLRSVLARVYAVSTQNQINNTVP